MSQPNKLTRGKDSSYNTSNTFQYLKFGEVMSVDDPLGLNRIKVWIKGSVANGGDDELLGGTVGYEKLPFCLPLMPKYIMIKHLRPLGIGFSGSSIPK